MNSRLPEKIGSVICVTARSGKASYRRTDLGLSPASLDDLVGGDATVNAAITRGILSGELHGPKRDVVLLNVAAALATESGDWESGLAAAAQSIDSGSAQNALDGFIEKTQSYSDEQ